MATAKEIEALMRVVHAGLKVNASSERVNVEVEISNCRVSVKISDPVEVLASCSDASKWDWLFYDGHSAYFSGEIFSEEEFVARCQEFVDVINGFEGRTVQEVA